MKTITEKLPDRETKTGRAWRCDPAAIARRMNLTIHATVATWVIEAKWAHPFWCNYYLTGCHLRKVAGVPAPIIYLPGATHEVALLALHPDFVPDLDNPARRHLLPANFGGQWIAASDIDAEMRIEKCVDEILAGDLSPDTDFRRQWVERFSASNLIS